jgi:hypothetical protein
MSGSLLTYLDILIGFALVMLLASSIVTVLSQWLLNLRNYRAVILREGLKRLLIQVDANLAPQADKIAKTVLLHPLVAGVNWNGKDREGVVIQREQLARVLLEVAATQLQLGNDGAHIKALRKALDLDETDGDTPKALLEAIQARIVQLEIEFPSAATHMLRARAIVENASARFISGLMSWFDETSGRMTQIFAQHARALTISLSAIVAIVLPLDSIDLLRRLALDEAVRSRLVEAAQKLEQRPGTAEWTDGQSGGGTTQETNQPQGHIESDTSQAGKNQPKTASSSSEYAEVRRLRTDLEALAIIPSGGVWTLLSQPKGGEKLLDALPGILLSICLMSLGAPFWFEALKHLLKLRPTLAQTEEKERQERKDVLSANSGLAFAARESEVGDLGADAIASHPGGEG